VVSGLVRKRPSLPFQSRAESLPPDGSPKLIALAHFAMSPIHHFLRVRRACLWYHVLKPITSTDSMRKAMSVREIMILAFNVVTSVALFGALIFASLPRRDRAVTPPTLDWSFLNASVSSENQRLRFQVASDIYWALQTRLDGYRQSAAAIFLGVIAGLLTLDASLISNFGKTIVGVETVDKSQALAIHSRIGYILLACAIMLVVAGSFTFRILWTIRYYFAEMAGVVYKFDLANKVFVTDAWFPAQTLYPHSFRTDKTLTVGAVLYMFGMIFP
jgi:hypothetical protein